MNLFLWGALPYIAFTFLIVGTLVRFFYFERNWTTKSSEFLEKKQLKWGSLLFHLGIIPVFFGHVVGLAIPAKWIDGLGVSEEMYHFGAVYIGSIFGIMTFIGMLLLTLFRLYLDFSIFFTNFFPKEGDPGGDKGGSVK